MSTDYIRLEDERTRDLSEGEIEFFRSFPFYNCFTAPDSWHIPLISLHDYVVAMSQLDLQPFDLVLDFGCGPGWVTEFAARHGMRMVGVDVSEGTLKIAKERAESHGVGDRAHFVKGDVQCLPFRDGSFQAVICIAALHHIEAMDRAVAEVGRILRPDGEAIFLEPGEGHAQQEISQQATEDHGTLEQDVVPDDVFRWASAAGFAEFHVVPQYFAFPAMRWNHHQWREHVKMAEGRRPESSSGWFRRLIQLLRLWKSARSWREVARQQFPAEWLYHLHFDQWMHDHSCYLMRKSSGKRPMGSSWAGGLSATIDPIGLRAEGDEWVLGVRIRNTGQACWLIWKEFGEVRVGLQRLDPVSGEVADLDFARFGLPEDVDPGRDVTWELRSPRPKAEGPLRLRVDLVSEQVKWFEAKTSDGGDPVIEFEAPGSVA